MRWSSSEREEDEDDEAIGCADLPQKDEDVAAADDDGSSLESCPWDMSSPPVLLVQVSPAEGLPGADLLTASSLVPSPPGLDFCPPCGSLCS